MKYYILAAVVYTYKLHNNCLMAPGQSCIYSSEYFRSI